MRSTRPGNRSRAPTIRLNRTRSASSPTVSWQSSTAPTAWPRIRELSTAWSFKYQNINGGEIIYSTDSILKVINIFGEYSGGATYNPYSEYYIFGKNKIISSGNGKVSKLNYISKKEYLIYINDYSRMGDDINKYYLTFRKDSIILNKFLNHTNKNK